MTEQQIEFYVSLAAMLFREGFADCLNGQECKRYQGASYYTGWNDAYVLHGSGYPVNEDEMRD